MNLRQILSALSPVHIRFFTLFSGGRCMGRDVQGNTYYQSKARKGYNHPRRWVLYKGPPDASSVPAEWHGWLHYQTDVLPGDKTQSYRRTWQKPHQPNMTGTDAAYLPPGHVLKGFQRDVATGDYQAWSPEKENEGKTRT